MLVDRRHDCEVHTLHEGAALVHDSERPVIDRMIAATVKCVRTKYPVSSVSGRKIIVARVSWRLRRGDR